MAITLSYLCSKCTFRSNILTDAEDHAQRMSHVVNINGTLTPKITFDKESIEAAAERRAREQIIMRLAKQRGLVKEK